MTFFLPHIFWLALSSTITFSQSCLWALCPSCALPASLKGFLSSNTHVIVVFIRAGNEKCKFSQGTPQKIVFPRNWIFVFLDFLLPPHSWRTKLTPVPTSEATKQGLNSGNSHNFIMFEVLKTFSLLLKFFLEEKPKYYRVKEESMRKRLNVMIKINAKLWPKVNPVLSVNSSKPNCKLSHNDLKTHLVLYRRNVIFFFFLCCSFTILHQQVKW